MPLTLPLPSAVACAHTLEQVSSIVLLAPSVPNPVGSPRVLIIASVCVKEEAFKFENQVKPRKGIQ